MREKIIAFAQLTRIEHAFMLVVAVVIGETIALKQLPGLWTILLSGLAPFFIELGSFAINDYYDVESDKKNKRLDRPLVRGAMKPKTAEKIALTSFALGVAASWFVNPACFIISLFFASAAYYYSWRLKDAPLAGNVFVAFCMAVPFVYGSLAVTSSVPQTVLILALMATLVGVGREIAGTIRDLEGDTARGSKTLPMIWGKRKASLFSAFLIISAVLISPVPFLSDPNHSDIYYVFFVGTADALLLWSAVAVWRQRGKKELKKVRNTTLLALNVGLMGFLLSSLL